MTLDKFFSGFKKKWRKNLYYNFYFQNVHRHLQFEIAHALQLIGADSGEAVSESEAYLELARNIKNWIQIYLTTAGKGLKCKTEHVSAWSQVVRTKMSDNFFLPHDQ